MAADAPFGQPRITAPINETNLVRIPNNIVKAFNAANDRGAIADDFPLEHLQLQLQRSAAQEQAVEAFIDALHNPKSPEFHKWLSAQEFGARFGVAASDLDTVQQWLAGHGFQVNFVHPNGMIIDFSGTAGLVKAAFHSEIHRLDVNGVAHIANASDPSIPAALQPVVAGVISLTDFRAHPKHRKRAFYTGTNQCNGPCYLVTPSDLATIYNFNPLFQAATPITGRGRRLQSWRIRTSTTIKIGLIFAMPSVCPNMSMAPWRLCTQRLQVERLAQIQEIPSSPSLMAPSCSTTTRRRLTPNGPALPRPTQKFWWQPAKPPKLRMACTSPSRTS